MKARTVGAPIGKNRGRPAFPMGTRLTRVEGMSRLKGTAMPVFDSQKALRDNWPPLSPWAIAVLADYLLSCGAFVASSAPGYF